MDPINTSTSVVPEPDMFIMLLKNIGILGLVLGILILVLFLLKRYSFHGSAGMATNLIRVAASYHVGPREKILLLDVMGEKILVGVTSQAISALAVLDKEGFRELNADSPSEKGFAALLKNAISGKGRKTEGGSHGDL